MANEKSNCEITPQIDFKEILDNIDESIYIADGNGKTIYVNPSYTRNTGITEDEVLGKTVYEIEQKGLFTKGAVSTVLETRKRCFILCTTNRTNPPRPGYVSGVPIFDDNGRIKFVIASSRPIKTLANLRDYYPQFLIEAKNNLRDVEIIQTSKFSSFNTIIGNSPAMQKIYQIIHRVAPTNATVLITGESGVGKEVVADDIYRMSTRSNSPFVKVNCAAIPNSLLESELFGYEKGAFSNAASHGKKGLFELANNGTILLDEIGEMPLDLQAKLLRAIQNLQIIRVGGTTPISLNIRIIAATNCNLLKRIQEGSFRQDLYYRLCVVPIDVPPLRERREDIPLLCNHFLKRASSQYGHEFSFTKKQINVLCKHSWPGNIRELENLIQYYAICSQGEEKADLDMLSSLIGISSTSSSVHVNGSLSNSVNCIEKSIIEDALSKTSNLRDAGKLLNVSASTLSRKIKSYGITYTRSKKKTNCL